MLVVVSDTHSTDGHRLTNRTLDAVRDADLVVHAGDFMRESVLDAFIDESEEFLAVYGNNDGPEIRARIPEARNFTYGGVEFAVTHTRRGGGTALSLFGRERGADAVIFGHSHRPTFDGTGEIPLVNPGSHAQPRGNRQAHAEFEELPDGGLRGRLVTVDGDVFQTFRVVPGGH
ncbi:YfcE family phosphodiesterase [Haloferax sp. MBLA0076]|uniref:Phosphoesterase n=1 Tax=Haloferax litoreum TaxID=2666140 RepID=A0A6A8GE61_9EURY|nr:MULTISPECIES: metallophosphoesterase [Haloferax]KAB1192646.1 metallophosphoesterase [Haloferax sp. CBA1148]MRX21121.1 YfcE family phosphodiesterase [Haloferax litoreum]